MRRDIPRLADTTFDLLIVGAGIYGACAAWNAPLRGLSVAVVDQDGVRGGHFGQQPGDCSRQAGTDAVMRQARVPGPAMAAVR